MGIVARFFKVGQAGANRLVDKLEKPELMLDQAIRDRQKSIADAKQKVQSVIATERQTKAMIDKYESEASTWTERAEKALKAGEDALAEKALTRAEESRTAAESAKPNWQLQRRSVDRLKVDLKQMDDELAELKRNKDIIVAQSKTAEVKKSIYQAKASMGRDSSSDLISRMKEKSERLGFEAQAAEELADNSQDSLESQIDKLEGDTTSDAVKQRLAAMKANLSKQ